ncbi:MAG TPA: glycosyltransferase family 39 protein [Candidatus Woesebacteria bacterium]|nr:glycosyltransferase family 39 protein [Candidatus Woesebacteria bacterium]
MKKYLFLIIAIALGTFLRLWQLSAVPNGLTWDEAAIGYNAYSILKTGRDEHGAFMPLIFKSFGDYKPGAYIYFTVPAVAIFGLNEFAVRFPSALAGILAIFGVYLLVKELFSEKKLKPIRIFSIDINIWDFSAIALAVSPWHVHFGHGAWEVNVFSTVMVFAMYFFLRFIKNKSSIFPLISLVCLSLATYQAAKMLTPFIFLFLAIVYWRDFWHQTLPLLKPRKIVPLLPFILFALWILFGSIFSSAGNRLATLSVFNYKPGISEATRQIDGSTSPYISLFHNQTELSFHMVMSRYLYHFSPEVLFYEGSLFSERAHIPSLGVLHPLEIIWLVLGLIWLTRLFPNKQTIVILGLLLIAPIPASLTLAEFSTYRALFMVIPLSIISGIGMYYGIQKIKWFIAPVFLLYFIVSVYVFDIYFLHSQAVFAKEFNYGYKQAVEIIKENPTQRVIFTDVLGQPYIYYVFYTGYDPSTYQKNIDFIDGGLDVGRVGHVGNVEFHQFGNDELTHLKDTLLVGSEGNIDRSFDITGENVALFKQINTPDDKIIFRIVKTKP